MATLFKWLFYGGYSSLDDFNLIISPNIMTKQKGKGSQGIKVIEAYQYRNKRIVKQEIT